MCRVLCVLCDIGIMCSSNSSSCGWFRVGLFKGNDLDDRLTCFREHIVFALMNTKRDTASLRDTL